MTTRTSIPLSAVHAAVFRDPIPIDARRPLADIEALFDRLGWRALP